jgi:very-short-patch-repair endonuclease
MSAAVLACGSGTVVSHGTAAALLDIWDRPPRWVNVIAPVESGRRIDGIRRRHPPHPTPDETEVRDSIACTSASRTLIDIAGTSSEASLSRTVERAAVRGLLDVPAVGALLARHRRRGSARLRRVLEVWQPSSGRLLLRSELEARLLPLIAARGLPAPLCNQRVEVDTRRLEVDLLWPGQRVVVEGDGRAFHDTQFAFERDRRRDRELVAAGYRVLRVTWKQLEREPDRVLGAIAQLIRG